MNWKEQLFKHFGFEGKDGTYVYILNRVKEARHYGTLTIDDFSEVDPDEDWYQELEQLISTEIIEKLIEDIPDEFEFTHLTDKHSYFKGNVKWFKQQLRDKWL